MVTSSFKDRDLSVKYCKLLAKRNLYVRQLNNDRLKNEDSLVQPMLTDKI